MLKSKIHRATLTGAELEYEGSITIDKTLMEKAGILPGEQVHVLNCNNGSRCVTYAIEASEGSGAIVLNGPAAHLGKPGDLVVILSYCSMTEKEAIGNKPEVVFVDGSNRIIIK